jgi:hypothetical protein
MQNLAGLVAAHPLPRGVTDAYPIGPDGFGALDAPVSKANPVPIELKVRVGGSLAFCALSRYVNAKGLTAVVWRELLRLAHHLLATRDLPLVFTRIGTGARLEAVVDLAQNNGGMLERRSFGGYTMRMGHPERPPQRAPCVGG